MRLTYNRSCSHNRPQTAACNAVYSISRRALLITRLGEQLPRPRQVSMPLETILGVLTGVEGRDVLWEKPFSLSHTQSVSSAGLATSIFGSQVHDREVPYSFPEGFKYPWRRPCSHFPPRTHFSHPSTSPKNLSLSWYVFQNLPKSRNLCAHLRYFPIPIQSSS